MAASETVKLDIKDVPGTKEKWRIMLRGEDFCIMHDDLTLSVRNEAGQMVTYRAVNGDTNA